MIASVRRTLALLTFVAAPLALPSDAYANPGSARIRRDDPLPIRDDSRTHQAASVAPLALRLDTVVVAGGCFWGVQAVFQHLKGVVSATSGYAGGAVANPGYEQVSGGRTGHAESVRVVFDPAVLSYDTLLEVFFTVAHDPTQLNRQGPDVGTQYRSAIFYANAAQHLATARYVAALVKPGARRRPIVTQVLPLRAFFPAEAYHQDYATRHPDDPYIVYNDAPKIEALRTRYAALWNDRIAKH